MNENHRQALVVKFRHIDDLLNQVRQILVPDSASLFTNYTADASPEQHKIIEDHLLKLRETMNRIMTELNLPPPSPVCGALWAVQIRTNDAKLALAGLEAKQMIGYGPLSEQDIKVFGEISAELGVTLEQLELYLASEPAN
jgi:hypothetical protein